MKLHIFLVKLKTKQIELLMKKNIDDFKRKKFIYNNSKFYSVYNTKNDYWHVLIFSPSISEKINIIESLNKIEVLDD